MNSQEFTEKAGLSRLTLSIEGNLQRRWRRTKPAAIAIASLLLLGSPLQAEEIEAARNTEAFREHIRLVPQELISPWTDAKPWLIGGAVATTLLFIYKDSVGDPLQKSFSTNRPLGELSHYGDLGGRGILNGLYSIGMLSHWYFARDSKSLERAILMFKLSFYSTNITSVMKSAFHELRPNFSDHRSFPSGHSTAAFAFASFVAAEHEWPYGVAALSLATLTALSRINDNAHYLHDVVGGATVGTVYGLGVSHFHSRIRREKEGPGTESGFRYHVMPIYSSDAKGLALMGEF